MPHGKNPSVSLIMIAFWLISSNALSVGCLMEAVMWKSKHPDDQDCIFCIPVHFEKFMVTSNPQWTPRASNFCKVSILLLLQFLWTPAHCHRSNFKQFRHIFFCDCHTRKNCSRRILFSQKSQHKYTSVKTDGRTDRRTDGQTDRTRANL